MSYRASAVVLLVFVCSNAAAASSSDYLEGMIEPYLQVKISSQVPGIIDQVLVERGDLVKKGQVVAKLRAGVEKADVELATVQVGFSKRKLDRNRGALRRGAHLGKRKG